MRTKLDSSTPHLGGDGGGLLFIAFVLALILMLLASCRSKQVTINEQVDSVCVSNTLLAEIRSQMLDFSFDSMEIVVPENQLCELCDNVTRCHKRFELNDRRGVKRFSTCSIKIKGGRIKAESLESRAERCEKKDSVKVVSKMEAKSVPYTYYYWFIAGALVVLLVLFYIRIR